MGRLQSRLVARLLSDQRIDPQLGLVHPGRFTDIFCNILGKYMGDSKNGLVVAHCPLQYGPFPLLLTLVHQADVSLAKLGSAWYICWAEPNGDRRSGLHFLSSPCQIKQEAFAPGKKFDSSELAHYLLNKMKERPAKWGEIYGALWRKGRETLCFSKCTVNF